MQNIWRCTYMYIVHVYSKQTNPHVHVWCLEYSTLQSRQQAFVVLLWLLVPDFTHHNNPFIDFLIVYMLLQPLRQWSSFYRYRKSILGCISMYNYFTVYFLCLIQALSLPRLQTNSRGRVTPLLFIRLCLIKWIHP